MPRSNIFGPREWNNAFGQEIAPAGTAPDDPTHGAPDAPCPFTAGRTVGETHFSIYIPPTFGPFPPTLMGLRRLIAQRADVAFAGELDDCWYAQEPFANSSVENGWAVMVADPVANSAGLTHKKQKGLIKRAGYVTARAALVATCLAVRRICGSPYDEKIPWGRVEEQIGEGRRIRIGYFGGLLRVSQRWAGKRYPDTGVFAQKLTAAENLLPAADVHA